ncbi:MAG: hypothetical protein LBC87_07940 [Fibromonadaceae bacterium]|nr:hypothetical protein [Fibromonadaceae bacterium]
MIKHCLNIILDTLFSIFTLDMVAFGNKIAFGRPCTARSRSEKCVSMYLALVGQKPAPSASLAILPPPPLSSFV